MKTIFVLIPHGYVLRNIVTTGTLDKLLARPNLRVIALTFSPEALDHLKPHNSRLIVKQFPISSRLKLSNAIHRILRVRFDKINENQALKRLEKFYRIYRFGYINYLLDRIITQPLPRSRRIYRWIHTLGERYKGVSKDVCSLFEFYQPTLVFSTNPNRIIEYHFLKYAKQFGITTLGMIKSWDVILTKGYIPVPTDYYLVWNHIMKRDLMKLHNLPEEIIGVTGVPQFDIYTESIATSRRKEFLEQLGLDPQKKTILFSTSAPWIGIQEPAILNCLAQSLADNTSFQNMQILARLHPADEPLRYQNINYPNLVYQFPGLKTDIRDNERFLDPNYLFLLRDALTSADLIVNTASTLTLECVFLDKPVVNLAFDVVSVNYWSSSQRFYEYEHYIPVVNSGAVKIARSLDELITMVLRYLEEPHLEKQERANLRESMCYKLDGHSAQRVADHMFCLLDGKPFNDVFN